MAKKIDDSEISSQLLLSLTRGSKSRKNILKVLLYSPRNCNQLADKLELDWWTIQKHLQRLLRRKMIKSLNFGRIKYYIITSQGEEAIKMF